MRIIKLLLGIIVRLLVVLILASGLIVLLAKLDFLTVNFDHPDFPHALDFLKNFL